MLIKINLAPVFSTCFICCVMLFSIQGGFSQTTIANSGFEKHQAEKPLLWNISAFKESGFVHVSDSAVAHSGTSSVRIETTVPNDIRLVQYVSVKPDTLYEISCWVKTSDTSSQNKKPSVCISIPGTLARSRDLSAGPNSWTKILLAGKTGSGQTELPVAVGIGSYGNLSAGRAWFDDISIRELPPGAALTQTSFVNFDPSQTEHASVTTPFSVDIPALFFILCVGILFVVLIKIFLRFVLEKNRFQELASLKLTGMLAAGFAGVFIVRILLAAGSFGFPNDFACFSGWSETAFTKGFSHVYTDSQFTDYPPLYLYILWIVGGIRNLFGLSFQSPLYYILIKLPAIFADLVTALVIFKWGKKRIHHGWALLLSFLYFLNPAILFNSSVWGQVDTVFTLFIVIAILSAGNKRLLLTGLFFTFAVLTKISALVCAPVILFTFIRSHSWKKIAISVIVSLAAAVLIILPFSFKQSPFWIISLYGESLAQYPFASLNAANLYSLLGLNFSPDSTSLLFPVFAWNFIWLFIITGISGIIFFRSHHGARKILLVFFLFSATFLFGSKMHERYLFPALVFLLLGFILCKDRRLLYLYGGFSATLFINQAVVYYLVNQTGSYHIPGNDFFLVSLSAVNCGLFLFSLKTLYDILLKKRIVEIRKIPINLFAPGLPRFQKIRKIMPFLKNHRAIIIVTILYGLISLYGLGLTNTPQTYWNPLHTGEQGIAEFDRPEPISQLRLYTGYGIGGYSIDFSRDRTTWESPVTISQDTPYRYIEWRVIPVSVTAKYMRITTSRPGLRLFEAAAKNAGGTVLPIASCREVDPVSGSSTVFSAVFDEQTSAQLPASWLNGMYFDEVYFARTAYEYIENDQPTETTHPPLGKLIISLGIMLFGMNPFGWRIMGVLAGIILLPVMYTFGIALFRRKLPALAAVFLMAVDFMHFVQSRMATVDIFLVLFMTISAYFLFRYTKLLFSKQEDTLPFFPLLTAGIFFGLAVSVKWTGMYLAPGFFILFIFTVIQFLKYSISSNKGKTRGTPLLFLWRTGKIFLLCALIVPASIYLISSTPSLYRNREKNIFREFVREQENMYAYHKNLKTEHEFSSKWWSWPLVEKPIWLYQGTENIPHGFISSIVSMGNPLVWWMGTLAIISAAMFAILKREKAGMFIIISFLLTYLPWIIIPRDLTFIYHFFPAVPFIIFALVYSVQHLVKLKREFRYAGYIFCILCGILFVLFYPVLTGIPIAKDFVDIALKWLPSWIFHA
ncbi:MAG: phospholipid carrier-dependent glycosyltransferase [Spirochaetales bacterium]|nr:phospholipid carrier-dependent glycosyltransferase [Spirochaetales bacterium]